MTHWTTVLQLGCSHQWLLRRFLPAVFVHVLVKLIEVRKEFVLVGENNGIFMHVANSLLPIVFNSFASVVISLFPVVENLQAELKL